MDEPSSATKEYYVYFPRRPFAGRRTRAGFPVSVKRPEGSALLMMGGDTSTAAQSPDAQALRHRHEVRATGHSSLLLTHD